MRAWQRHQGREDRRRLYFFLIAILLLLSLMFYFFLRIWQRRPEPRFMFLNNASLAQEQSADALIIREETVYATPVAGVFRPIVPQGSKVARHAVVGQIVPVSDYDLLRQLDKASNDVNDKRYELLAEGKGGDARRVFAASEEEIRRNIHILYDAMLNEQNSKALAVEDDLRLIMDQRVEDAALFTIDDEDLQNLQESLDRLEKRAANEVREITSEASGTFVRVVDGLESTLTPEKALSITAAEVKSMLAGVLPGNIPETVAAGDPLYKLCRTSEQHFICILPTGTFPVDRDSWPTVRLESELNGIRLDQVSIERAEETEAGLLVAFRSSESPEAFSTFRSTPLTVFLDEQVGLRVPLSALTEWNEGKTRATLSLIDGGYCHRTSVQVLAQNDTYALIKEEADSPCPVQESTLILLNPESMEEGDPIDKALR